MGSLLQIPLLSLGLDRSNLPKQVPGNFFPLECLSRAVGNVGLVFFFSPLNIWDVWKTLGCFRGLAGMVGWMEFGNSVVTGIPWDVPYGTGSSGVGIGSAHIGNGQLLEFFGASQRDETPPACRAAPGLGAWPVTPMKFQSGILSRDFALLLPSCPVRLLFGSSSGNCLGKLSRA